MRPKVAEFTHLDLCPREEKVKPENRKRPDGMAQAHATLWFRRHFVVQAPLRGAGQQPGQARIQIIIALISESHNKKAPSVSGRRSHFLSALHPRSELVPEDLI